MYLSTYYLSTMKNEIIWSHIHDIFDKNEIKTARRTLTLLYIRTPFLEILDPPLQLVPIFVQLEY